MSWDERRLEYHLVDDDGSGQEGLRLGLVNDGRRQLWFPRADFERWVELAEGVTRERGEDPPSFVRALREGTGPFKWKVFRLVMAPSDGRVLEEIAPFVDARASGRDSSPREVLELAIALFAYADQTRQRVTLDRL